MNEARVEVRVTARSLAAHGADDVTILLAANPGVEPGPLGAAASGGELSRISLAVRVVSLASTDLPTLIFDEVDAGVGGRTALAVAEKLSMLARSTQVICVTHLAQVAARGDRHFRLVKEPGDPTVTRIERLEGAESDRELARMLGGAEDSADALALARSLRSGARPDAECSGANELGLGHPPGLAGSYDVAMTVRFSLVGIVVADMATSLAFYRRLGLDLPSGAESEDHVEITLPGGVRMAWDTEDTVRSFDSSWTPPSGGHRVALAFACDTPDEVDLTFADLIGAGYPAHLEPWDAFWGQRYAVVSDPDGNHVEIFAPLT